MGSERSRVFSVMLRVDARGYEGPPPHLPEPPDVVHGPEEAPRFFGYSLGLGSMDASVDAACGLVLAVIDQEVARSGSALQDAVFRSRCRLDFGISVAGDAATFSYRWPSDFMARLGGLGITVEASHYLDEAFREITEEDRSPDDGSPPKAR